MKRKKKNTWVGPTAVSLNIAVPVAAAMMHTIPVYVLLAASLLFFVKVMPFCRKRENLWMFFLVAVCTVPMNVSIIIGFTGTFRFILRLLFCPLAYLVLLSVEEIIMGCTARRLWHRQYRLPYSG